MKRRSFGAEFNTKISLEALKGFEPIHVIAQRHEIHPVQVGQWKNEVATRLPEVFAKPSTKVRDDLQRDRKQKHPHAEIGQLKMELDWLIKKAGPY